MAHPFNAAVVVYCTRCGKPTHSTCRCEKR